MSPLPATIEAVGYGITGEIGGLPRQTYYTPDGRVIRAIPNIREYVRKDKDGKVIAQGTRDANLDKGWLTLKPADLKPYCKACDRWHDTLAEVRACYAKQRKIEQAALAKEEAEKAADAEPLTQRMDRLEESINKILTALEKK